MSNTINKDIYYCSNELLSKNRLFNFAIGIRGNGKTYELKSKGIKRFIKKGEQFIYIRRYKTELKRISTFFDDIAHEFPNHKLEVKGYIFYCDDEIMGYAIPLSTAGNFKSIPFPKVTLIIYDEFIINNRFSRYLPSEVTLFLETFETIARLRDNVRVVFLANAVSVINPYFNYFDIAIDMDKRFNFVGKEIVVELTSSEGFKEEKEKTKFGSLIKGTKYGEYNMENKFLNDDEYFLCKRTSSSVLQLVISFKNETVGFWWDSKTQLFYATENYDKDFPIHYSLSSSDHKPNTVLVQNYQKDFWTKNIINAYKGGYLMFDTQRTKGAVLSMLRYMNVR